MSLAEPGQTGGEGTLAEWLEAQAALQPHSAAAVAVWEAGAVQTCAVGDPRFQAALGRIPLGCLSKLFTAHAILRLVQQGRLSLQDRAAAIFAEHGFGDLTIPGDVRIGHLLAHTSGLAGVSLEALKAYLAQPWPAADGPFVFEAVAEPGAVYCYDNANYLVLTHVLRLAAGREWLDAVDALVFAPLAAHGLAGALPAYSADRAGAGANHIGAWTHDIAIDPEALCRYAAIHAAPEELDAETAEIVGWFREQPDWAPRLGHTDIKGFAWKHMVSGDFGHFGVSEIGRVGVYVSPRRARCAALMVSGQVSPLYQEILAKLDFMAVPVSVRDAMADSEPASASAYLGIYRSGPYELHISEGEHGLKVAFGDEWRRGGRSLPPELTIRPIRPRLYQYFVPYDPQYFEFIGEETAEDFPYLRYGEVLLRKDGGAG